MNQCKNSFYKGTLNKGFTMREVQTTKKAVNDIINESNNSYLLTCESRMGSNEILTYLVADLITKNKSNKENVYYYISFGRDPKEFYNTLYDIYPGIVSSFTENTILEVLYLEEDNNIHTLDKLIREVVMHDNVKCIVFENITSSKNFYSTSASVSKVYLSSRLTLLAKEHNTNIIARIQTIAKGNIL